MTLSPRRRKVYSQFRATFIIPEIARYYLFSILEAKTASKDEIEVVGEIGDPNLLYPMLLWSRNACVIANSMTLREKTTNRAPRPLVFDRGKNLFIICSPNQRQRIQPFFEREGHLTFFQPSRNMD